MKPKLALDVDSTIYDPQDLYDQAAMDLFGKKFFYKGRKEWYEPADLEARFGPNWQDVFNEALHQKHFHLRKLYPGVVETVEMLEDHEVDVHFVTHNKVPGIREPLKRWLTENFGDVGLSITTVEDKGRILKSIGAFGLVDDAPKYLKMAQDLDIWLAVREQPWNKGFRAENPDIFSFSDWFEFKNRLEEVLPIPLGLEVGV